VLPYDASCEDLVISQDLPFLNSFVKVKLDQGAKPYKDFMQRQEEKENGEGGGLPELGVKAGGLNFEAYAAPTRSTQYPAAPTSDLSSLGNMDAPSNEGTTGLKVTGPTKWGPAGFNGPSEKKPDPPRWEEPKPSSDPSPSASPFAPKTVSAPEPPELTEKQKMAAALFSGLGGPSAKSAPKPPFAGATIGGGATKPPAPVPAAAPKKAPEPAAAPPPPAPSAGVMDLLDFGSPPAKPAAPPATSVVTSAANDLLDMGMGDSGCDLLGAATVVTPAAPTPPVHFLGPLAVTTQQVGANWQQLPTERRLQLQTSMSTCKDMMNRLQNSVNVHPVEIIGMEGIAAGQVLPNNGPVFLHGKLAPPRLDLLVRCQDAGVADRVIEVCRQALA